MTDFGDNFSITASSTYSSTFSTNMTMSNLIGPGRALGNLYSMVGRSLEKRFRARDKREIEAVATRIREDCLFRQTLRTEPADPQPYTWVDESIEQAILFDCWRLLAFAAFAFLSNSIICSLS